MKLDPLKLSNQREILGYSQQNVADKSRLCSRTVERAAAGKSINHETAASIAATLGTTLSSLLLDENTYEAAQQVGRTTSLRRATSGRAILDTLDTTAMGVIECDVEATNDNLLLLKNIAHLLESNMKDPMAPIERSRRPLSERLELIAAINEALNELQAAGVCVFVAETWVEAYFPNFLEFGEPYFPDGKQPIGCRAVRMVIAEAGSEKIVRPNLVSWPLEHF